MRARKVSTLALRKVTTSTCWLLAVSTRPSAMSCAASSDKVNVLPLPGTALTAMRPER